MTIAGRAMGRAAGRSARRTDSGTASVIGSGPNGLAAAVTLARAGLRVTVYEAADTAGGGLRSADLFESGVRHDICSAVHPMAAASPFFRRFDLSAHGVELLTPALSFAHPLGNGRPPGLAWHSLEVTAEGLGADGAAWRQLMGPLREHSQELVRLMLSDYRSVPRGLTAPLLLASRLTAERRLRTPQAAALLAGVAAHAVGPLPSLTGAATGLLLGHLAHTGGWPLPAGGSRSIAEALIADLEAHGGRVVTGHRIDDLRELDSAGTGSAGPGSAGLILADLGPREFLRISRGRLPTGYARALDRFRYGPGAAKTDLLLDSPVPWRDPELRIAGTVHLGGTREELYRAERETSRGFATRNPFVLVTEPANTDPGRAVGGRYPLWAYAHVPHGRPVDAEEAIISRIEEHAPGFRDTIVAARSVPASGMEAYNPNYVGGDIGAGAVTIRQTLFRPAARWNPYATPLPGVYLCSAATPPGPGVHGMCGYLAARAALAAAGSGVLEELRARVGAWRFEDTTQPGMT